MSKYTITHSCGHQVEHQLFGKHTGFGGRDSKAEWLQSQPCLECKRKQEEEDRSHQNEEARIANERIGATPLTGSEKQIAWAESIRLQTLVAFTKLSDQLKTAPEPNLLVEYAVKGTLVWLMGKSEATWWIETIGTLKSSEGLAPLFGMISGKVPAASEKEILKHVMLESPSCSEEVANAIGLGEQFRARLAARNAQEAKAEMLNQLQSSKPSRPVWLQALRDKHGERYWNGKIYAGRRIFIANSEVKLTPDQEREIIEYQKSMADWQSKMASLVK